jgi:predicted nucleic acid-binding protein
MPIDRNNGIPTVPPPHDMPPKGRSGAIDALLAQLCIRHEPTMLTTDEDFTRIAAQYPLRLWTA